MEMIEDFNKSLKALYDHVGFVECWVILPVDDRTEMVWSVNEKEKYVRYAENIEKLDSDGDYYEDEIYTQRFYSHRIYRGEKLTMIMVDTHVDGNKFFAFYDNEKEVQDQMKKYDL